MRISAKTAYAAVALAVTAALIGVASGSASPVNPQPPGNIAVPTLTGIQVGQTLVGSPGTWGGGTPMTFNYFWLRSSGSGWVQIPVSGLTYTLTDADVGHQVFFQVKASNSDGYAIASSTPTTIVTGATAADTVALPSGGVSVLVNDVTLPDHLVVSSTTFSPAAIKAGGTVTAHVVVTDVFGHPVRGASVQLIPLPYGAVLRPAAAPTGNDGSVSIPLKATGKLSGAGKLVGVYVQVTKPGDDIAKGVTASTLVNLVVGR